jgi:hypothetical protein
VADNAVEVTDSTQQSMMQLEECNLEITGNRQRHQRDREEEPFPRPERDDRSLAGR